MKDLKTIIAYTRAVFFIISFGIALYQFLCRNTIYASVSLLFALHLANALRIDLLSMEK